MTDGTLPVDLPKLALLANGMYVAEAGRNEDSIQSLRISDILGNEGMVIHR